MSITPYSTISDQCGKKISTFDECLDFFKEKGSFHLLSDCQDALAQIIDEKGRSLLMRAIDASEQDLAVELIEKDICVQGKDKKGNTAYHIAAKCGEIAILGELFEKLQLDEENPRKRSPLVSAINRGQVKAVMTLLSNGADPKKRFSYKGLEVTPLGYAILRGELECVKVLTEQVDFTDHETSIGSLLHLAIHFQQNEVLRYLLSLNEGSINRQNKEGNTPFSYAVLADNAEALALLKLRGADIGRKNHDGYGPVHLAALHRPDLIETLAFLGCELTTLGDKDLKSPLDLLRKKKDHSPSQYNLLVNLTKQGLKVEHMPPHYGFRPPENLVFQGGGPKGVAYLGALEILYPMGILPQVLRVGGTSAGAINATILACGYGLEETKQLLTDTDLLEFIDNPALQSSLENKSSQPVTALSLVLRKIEQSMIKNPMGVLTSPIETLFAPLYEWTGLCEGNEFLKWMEKTICEKTQIRHCTFGELRRLIQEGKPFKHLHVIASNIKTDPSQITHISSEDPQWDGVIISDAVRASMSIPGVFVPHTLHKKVRGERVPARKLGAFIDGGLICNLPIQIFDKKEYILNGVSDEEKGCPMFNKRTLGFRLYTPTDGIPPCSKIENAKDLAKESFLLFRHAETILRNMNSYNQNRIINISNMGYGTLDFQMDDKDKKRLIDSGRRDTEAFFERHQGQSRSLFYFPRMTKEISNHIFLKEPHPYFIGRAENLKKIKQALKEHRKVVLYGPGGVGKTELAVQFANQNLEEYSLVWTIPSATEDERHNAYRHLAEALRIRLTHEETPEDIIRKVHNNLEQNKGTPWLLFYDDLNASVPLPSRGGHILITSYSEKGHALPVPPFTKQDAQKLITKITKERPSQSMDDLIELCGSYPLVIGMVATYISRIPDGTISQYLLDFPDRQSLLTLPTEERYQKTLEDSVHKTLEILPSKAKSWLLASSYLHATRIPISYLENWIKIAYPQERKNALQIRNEILMNLKEHHLMQKQDDVLVTHRLYQDALKFVENGEHLASIGQLLQDQIKWDLNETKNYQNELNKSQIWREQAHAFTKHPLFAELEPEKRGNLLYDLGKIAENNVELDKALKYYEQTHKIRKEILGERHRDVASSLSSIGSCYYSQGNYKEALNYHEQAFEIRKEILGERHQDTGSSLNGIGRCYHSQGKYKKALRKHEQALKIREEALGDKHPGVAHSLNSIGHCYKSEGKYKDALESYKKALKIRKEAFGDKHSSVAASLNDIGSCYYSEGRYIEALECFKQAFEIRKEALGDKHPDVGNTLNNIGLCYYSQGNYEQAFKTYRQALEIWKEALGDTHPKMGAFLNNVGLCYYSQGKYKSALSNFEKAHKIMKETLGDKHPEVASSLSSIGSCYGSQGKHKEALEYDKKALEIRMEALNKKHPDIGTSLNSIGFWYYSQGKHKEALEFYTKALEIRKEALGKNHPNVGSTLNNLGYCYYSQGKYQKALESYRQALEIRKEALGKNHPDIGTSLSNLGSCYYSQREYDEALEYYKKALKISKGSFGEKNPSYVDSLNNIGRCYNAQREYDKALDHHKRALEISKSSFGEKNPSVATSLNLIGCCYRSQAEYGKAYKYCHEAYEIAVDVLGKKHPTTKQISKDRDMAIGDGVCVIQ